MSADDHPAEHSRHERSTSVPGRCPLRWPVRRSDLAVFLSAEVRKHRRRRVEDALEIEQDNSREASAR